MAEGNGKTNRIGEELDVDHELTAGESPDADAAVADLQQSVDLLRQERDQLLDRVARLQAEFDNFRKRNAREQADFREYAVVDAARTLLPVLDSFDRALNLESQQSDLRAGMELIYRQLMDALQRIGVQVVSAAPGEPFDPHVHEALDTVETDQVEDGHIVGELQRGYKIKDRLLRPAMVRVARRT